MKKKLLALVLAAAMTLSLASCGGSKTETPSTGPDNSSASSDNSSAEGATYKVGMPAGAAPRAGRCNPGFYRRSE